ncbi:MAG: DoxX family protein [Planctomycetia bacterium]|nr:DoxX family protein [Planctomycetia bacterium]
MNAAYEGPINLAGRILLGLIFILSGLNKIGNWSGTAGFMESEGMVAVPLFLAGAILFEIAGGLSLAAGFKARIGALALVVFLIPASLIFHDFWKLEDPQAKQLQMILFLKNVAIGGGLLTILARGAGPWSLDERATIKT